MALTPTQRNILSKGRTPGGTPADHHPTDEVELLIHCGLITQPDLALVTTPAGRKLLDQPIYKRDPVRLMHGARMPHPDPQHRGTVPEPEMVDPRPVDIRRARDLGAQQRASFRADLEEERARRKRDRVNRMFRAA